MAATPTASLLEFVLGLALEPTAQDAGNRFAVEGLSFGRGPDGAIEVRIRKLEAASVRLASGPLTLEVATIAVRELTALVRIDGGKPRLSAVEGASAELAGVKLHGPLVLPASVADNAGPSGWMLGPLAAADGTIRAQIVDAHLLFDADVTVPIRQGRVDFRDTAVEHVGPDSRMGVSRLGLYVDAPNGRSYLYQFSSPPVAGVEYERRGAMLGPWVTDRGSLQLQPFTEWLLRQKWSGQASGVTAQARQLFDRTAVSGEVRLGDAGFAAPGVQARLVGRAGGSNVVRLHAEAVGRGLAVEIPSLAVRDAVLAAAGMQLEGKEIAGAVTLKLLVEGGQLRFAFDLPQAKVAGLRLSPAAPPR